MGQETLTCRCTAEKHVPDQQAFPKTKKLSKSSFNLRLVFLRFSPFFICGLVVIEWKTKPKKEKKNTIDYALIIFFRIKLHRNLFWQPQRKMSSNVQKKRNLNFKWDFCFCLSNFFNFRFCDINRLPSLLCFFLWFDCPHYAESPSHWRMSCVTRCLLAKSSGVSKKSSIEDKSEQCVESGEWERKLGLIW